MDGLEVDGEVSLLREDLPADVARGVAQVHLLVMVEGGGGREAPSAHAALVTCRGRTEWCRSVHGDIHVTQFAIYMGRCAEDVGCTNRCLLH